MLDSFYEAKKMSHNKSVTIHKIAQEEYLHYQLTIEISRNRIK